MTSGELIKELETFLKRLSEHRSLWSQSLDSTIPDLPIRNIPRLQEQQEELTSRFYVLDPYLSAFSKGRIMRHPATGTSWDIYQAATSNQVAPVKGDSLDQALLQIPGIIAVLKQFPPHHEVSPPLFKAKPKIVNSDSQTRRQPIGSPYGFDEHDWRTVEERRQRRDVLYVVLGYQFESNHCNADELQKNVRAMFEQAVNSYNWSASNSKIALDFRPLAAGYGEHLFNEIARDILSADIAVFETSDLNLNVALEMGVALTWGVSVFPIKKKGRRKPPSDISGQTWATTKTTRPTSLTPVTRLNSSSWFVGPRRKNLR
jgi:hypothetical protein